MSSVREILTPCKQSIDHYITYSVISSQPELSYSSVVSTIRAYPVTSGIHEGRTFVTWTGNFSSDADASESKESGERVTTDQGKLRFRMPSTSAATPSRTLLRPLPRNRLPMASEGIV